MTAAKLPFEVLISRHGASVLRVARALVGVQDADDVWQETFLAALRAYPRTDVKNVQAWLITITRNKAMDHHRRIATLPVPVGGVADLLPNHTASGTDAVIGAVESAEMAQAVWAALALLPNKRRHAVAYHHLAGLPYADVAELLGGTEAAARRAGADGMKSLRTLLAPWKGFDDDDKS
ncbi:RNA polymerase sigma factor [Arthrobacter cryoconiti]|uniref:RNA polymerase sigma factor n=1 Tax=Arthrobacter cryoconiti TaxID=748907 RepID=A0ABV8R116_9MICC|nr:RNA polymerase sigma factor [Arthrobacter cryoconiti]MCC9068068.1 RNA polymerase sigma factor [Arthrobacter cryoconiti]